MDKTKTKEHKDKTVPVVESLAKAFPEIAAEWDYCNNFGTPADYRPYSNKIKSWICPNGHTYMARISSRTCGTGCPYCKGTKAIKGVNDIAHLFPDLIASQWDFKKNTGVLDPQEITAGSERPAWWICPKGHSYKARIRNRILGKGCPYCAHKLPIKGETDLATVDPEIAKTWDTESNKIGPDEVLPSSSKTYWWRCPFCGRSYQMSPENRRRGCGCVYCASKKAVPGYNDLGTLFPGLAAEWDYERNYPLTPQDVTKSSSRKVWWICPVCGKRWATTVSSRTICGARCPSCKKPNR